MTVSCPPFLPQVATANPQIEPGAAVDLLFRPASPGPVTAGAHVRPAGARPPRPHLLEGEVGLPIDREAVDAPRTLELFGPGEQRPRATASGDRAVLSVQAEVRPADLGRPQPWRLRVTNTGRRRETFLGLMRYAGPVAIRSNTIPTPLAIAAVDAALALTGTSIRLHTGHNQSWIGLGGGRVPLLRFSLPKITHPLLGEVKVRDLRSRLALLTTQAADARLPNGALVLHVSFEDQGAEATFDKDALGIVPIAGGSVDLKDISMKLTFPIVAEDGGVTYAKNIGVDLDFRVASVRGHVLGPVPAKLVDAFVDVRKKIENALEPALRNFFRGGKIGGKTLRETVGEVLTTAARRETGPGRWMVRAAIRGPNVARHELLLCHRDEREVPVLSVPAEVVPVGQPADGYAPFLGRWRKIQESPPSPVPDHFDVEFRRDRSFAAFWPDGRFIEEGRVRELGVLRGRPYTKLLRAAQETVWYYTIGGSPRRLTITRADDGFTQVFQRV